MEKINVMHVVDKLSLGGASKHGVAQLLSWWFPEFDREKFNVKLVSLRKKDVGGELMEGEGIIIDYLGRGKFDFRTLGDLVERIRRDDIQVLHLHGYGATTFGRLAAMVTGIPAIVHEHFYDLKMPPYQRLADRVLSRATTRAIAVSKDTRDFMVKDRYLTPDSVEVFYNGAPPRVDNHQETNGPEKMDSWRSKMGIPQEHLVVGTVSRLHPVKGISYFLQAAKLVLDECQGVSFTISGDGDIIDDLKRESRELGIEQNVFFTGFVYEVAELLEEVDIQVIPSLSEGIPLTLFQGMTAGIPVVSTDVGGIKEVLEDGKAGFVVEQKDAGALADRIIRLVRDPGLREKMGQEGRRVADQYSIASTVRKFEDMYIELSETGR